MSAAAQLRAAWRAGDDDELERAIDAAATALDAASRLLTTMEAPRSRRATDAWWALKQAIIAAGD